MVEWQGTAGAIRQFFNPSGRREALLRWILTRGEDWPVINLWVRRHLMRDRIMKNADVAAA